MSDIYNITEYCTKVVVKVDNPITTSNIPVEDMVDEDIEMLLYHLDTKEAADAGS